MQNCSNYFDSTRLTKSFCLQINGSSSVLRCYNGMALAKMNRQDEAINYLKDAIRADPQNPLARFELASVLVSAGLLDDALKELLVLKVRRTSDDSFSSVVLICKACAARTVRFAQRPAFNTGDR